MPQCYHDKDKVRIDETARLHNVRRRLMVGAMNATMLTRWCIDKDQGDVDKHPANQRARPTGAPPRRPHWPCAAPLPSTAAQRECGPWCANTSGKPAVRLRRACLRQSVSGADLLLEPCLTKQAGLPGPQRKEHAHGRHAYQPRQADLFAGLLKLQGGRP